MPVVERVDQRDEALGLVPLRLAHHRDPVEDHRVVGAGECHVVGGAEGLATEIVEAEPGHAGRLLGNRHGPAVDRDRRWEAASLAGQGLEGGVEGRARRRVGGDMVDRRAAELLQPEIRPGVEADDGHAFLEVRHEGQEQRPVEAALVESVGLDVRGRDDGDAAPEQVVEQATQDHRVGDVGDSELVEAQQGRLVGQLVGHRSDRVVALDGAGLQRLTVGVDPLVRVGQETVEMDAPLRLRRRLVEEVHQHGLPAPDRAPDVQALDRLGLVLATEQPPQGARLAGPLAALEVDDQPVEGAHEVRLGGIALDGAGGDQRLVALVDRAWRDRTGERRRRRSYGLAGSVVHAAGSSLLIAVPVRHPLHPRRRSTTRGLFQCRASSA